MAYEGILKLRSNDDSTLLGEEYGVNQDYAKFEISADITPEQLGLDATHKASVILKHEIDRYRTTTPGSNSNTNPDDIMLPPNFEQTVRVSPSLYLMFVDEARRHFGELKVIALSEPSERQPGNISILLHNNARPKPLSVIIRGSSFLVHMTNIYIISSSRARAYQDVEKWVKMYANRELRGLCKKSRPLKNRIGSAFPRCTQSEKNSLWISSLSEFLSMLYSERIAWGPQKAEEFQTEIVRIIDDVQDYVDPHTSSYQTRNQIEEHNVNKTLQTKSIEVKMRLVFEYQYMTEPGRRMSQGNHKTALSKYREYIKKKSL